MKRLFYFIILIFCISNLKGQNIDPVIVQVLGETFERKELQKYRVQFRTDETGCAGNFILTGDYFGEIEQYNVSECILALPKKEIFFYAVETYFLLDIVILDNSNIIKIEGQVISDLFTSGSTIRVQAEMDDQGFPSITEFKYN